MNDIQFNILAAGFIRKKPIKEDTIIQIDSHFQSSESTIMEV